MFRSTGLLLLAMLLFLSGCDSSPQIRTLPPGATILAFGDSLTHGTGAPPGQSYPDILAEQLGHPVINAGIPGEVSAAGRARLPNLLEATRPALVILCHGGNDFLRHLDRATTIANLKAMIEACRASGADVVLIGVPELGIMVRPPEFYGELAEQYALPYEGEILGDLLRDRDLKSDTIHPNAAGYRLMANALGQLISQAQRD